MNAISLQYGYGKLSIQSEGVRLKPWLVDSIRKSASAVFRRYPRLLGLKIALKVDASRPNYREHVALIRLVLPGHDKVVEKRGENLLSLLGRSFDVANRQLRRRARVRKARRR